MGLGLTLADLSEIDRECQNMVKSIDYALHCFVTDNQWECQPKFDHL